MNDLVRTNATSRRGSGWKAWLASLGSLLLASCAMDVGEVDADIGSDSAAIISNPYTNCSSSWTTHPFFACTEIYQFECDNVVTGQREVVYEDLIVDGQCLEGLLGGGGGGSPGDDDPDCDFDWDCDSGFYCDYGTCTMWGC